MPYGSTLQNFPGYQLFDGGPVPLVISRLVDGVVLYANEAFLSLTGYSREETVGSSAVTRALWSNIAERARMVEAVRRDGFKHNLLLDLRRKSGELVQVMADAQVINVEGEPHIVTLLNDLRDVDGVLAADATERAHMDFVETACKIGFWNYDAATARVQWSYGMESIYGLPKGGFKGTEQDFLERIHPEDRALNGSETERAIATRQPFDIRYRIIRADGAMRWVASRGAARCAADGTLLGGSGIHVDITDGVEREQRLRLQEQVINSMSEGVVVIDAASGRIVSSNPRFDSMLGYAPGQLAGQPIAVVNVGSPAEQQAVADAVWVDLRRHGEWRGELKNRRADGGEIWVSANVAALKLDGKETVWVGVHSDITERRLAQDARDQALAQLRRLSLGRQDALEAERVALAREVHDQLGAALTGMRMKLESLAARLQAGDDVAPQDLLALAGKARSTQLAARAISTRLRPPLLDDLGLLEACRWYLADWSAQVGIAAHGRFRRLPEKPEGRLATDLFRLMQELLTNVARHSGASRVRVLLCAARGGVALRVRDNGQGFVKGHASQGFGLMGVQERVRQHRGQYQLDSGPDGSTVTVTLFDEVTP